MLLITLMLTCLVAHAGLSSTYLESIKSDLKAVETLKSSVQTQDHTICPGAPSKDMGSCLRRALSSMTIASSPQFVTLIALPVIAANTDKTLGFGGRVAGAMMLDNMTVVLERTDLAKFRLAQLNPATPVEKAELAQLQKDDEKLMDEGRLKVLAMIKEKLAELEKPNPARQPSSSDDWVKAKFAAVTNRLKTIEAKPWRYAPGPR